MDSSGSKHRNYELLNLIGYGLAKYGDGFLAEFGFRTKSSFFDYCVHHGVAETASTVKNRMDMFDPFFPESGRRGWWQRADDYIHRKIHIDSQFGDQSVREFASLVKLSITGGGKEEADSLNIQPIVRSRYRQLQETGLQAEQYFVNNFTKIEHFSRGVLQDARLLGDGYDFQINLDHSWHLAEVKGVREAAGTFRLTEREYRTAQEYQTDYSVVLVMNLQAIPSFVVMQDPTKNLRFVKKAVSGKVTHEYHSETISLSPPLL